MVSEAGDAFGEWGPAAEEELRAIEAAHASTSTSTSGKRRRHSDLLPSPSPPISPRLGRSRRRLPSGWSPRLSPHPSARKMPSPSSPDPLLKTLHFFH